MKTQNISYTPAYLEKHKLWDSQWLEKKYPDYFSKTKHKK